MRVTITKSNCSSLEENLGRPTGTRKTPAPDTTPSLMLAGSISTATLNKTYAALAGARPDPRSAYRPGLGDLPSPSDTYVLCAFCGAERYFLLARS